MSKKHEITKVLAKNIEIGYTIKLPAKLRADEVEIVSIEDGCRSMNVEPCTIHVAKIKGSYGPFRDLEATILLDSDGEVIVTKTPKPKSIFGSLLGSVSGLLTGCLIAAMIGFLVVFPMV